MSSSKWRGQPRPTWVMPPHDGKTALPDGVVVRSIEDYDRDVAAWEAANGTGYGIELINGRWRS